MGCMQEANGSDLSEAKVYYSVSRWIGFNLREEIAVIGRREKRHYWQAKRVKVQGILLVLQPPSNTCCTESTNRVLHLTHRSQAWPGLSGR